MSFFDDEIFFFRYEHCGTQRQTLSDDRRDCHIDLFRRFFLFFVGRERDESVLDMSLFSLLCSLITEQLALTTSSLVVEKTRGRRTTITTTTTTTHEFLDS